MLISRVGLLVGEERIKRFVKDIEFEKLPVRTVGEKVIASVDDLEKAIEKYPASVKCTLLVGVEEISDFVGQPVDVIRFLIRSGLPIDKVDGVPVSSKRAILSWLWNNKTYIEHNLGFQVMC